METANSLPTVSVCIPCIPIHVQYLHECLSSIQNQSILPEEVILILSEATPFIEKYVKDQIHPFLEKLNIRCEFFPDKRCTGSNRNAAIHLASGDIIVSMNADDLMFPQKIAVVKTIFYHNPEAVCLLHYFIENIKKDNMLLDESLFHEDLIQPYYFDERIHFGHASFRRSLFSQYSYATGISAEPGISDVTLIEQILPEHEKILLEYKQNIFEHKPKLLVYQEPLVSYMSMRSSFLNDYSKRMHDLFLYKLYAQFNPIQENTLPTVSVCIPCIPQHIQYLHDCFLSIARQTTLPDEVILVVSEATPLDDIEKEVTEQIAAFTEKFRIICKFFPDKQYAGINRNEAIKLACGDIIALMDADDMMCEGRIARIKRVFSQFPFAVCMLHHFVENVYSPIPATAFNPDIIEAYHFNDLLHCGHACFKRSLFTEFSYTAQRRGQDVAFIKKLLPKYIDKIVIDPEPLTLYISDRSSFYHLDLIADNSPLGGDSFSDPLLPAWQTLSKDLSSEIIITDDPDAESLHLSKRQRIQ